jgi:uncharacterized protein YbjT (DUF2867 family)
MSTATSPILVTGATGTVGRVVLAALQARGVAATAAVRDPKKAPGDAVSFDFTRPETFGPALAGRERVFLVGPPLVPELDALLAPFVDALASGPRRRVVYLSAYGMDHPSTLPFHRVLEGRLQAIPHLDVTILRPGFFAQNFATYSRREIEQQGVLFFPSGAGRTPFVDVGDLGRAAAAVLTGAGHAGKVYTLTGPVAWSMHEVAAELTRILGRTISYANPSYDAFRAALAGASMPPVLIDYFFKVYDMIARGLVADPTGDVQRLTGRAPRHPAEVLREGFASK